MGYTSEEIETNYRCRVIAEAMCDVTASVLWSRTKTWAYDRKPGMEFSTRVGAGNATYHRCVDHRHEITYGVGMIRSKHSDQNISSWTTGREIIQRQYYGGNLSLLNALSHTCLHEFGHLIQVITGKRTAGSVHNEAFYAILDRLHASEVASLVRHELNLRVREKGALLSHLPVISNCEI